MVLGNFLDVLIKIDIGCFYTGGWDGVVKKWSEKHRRVVRDYGVVSEDRVVGMAVHRGSGS